MDAVHDQYERYPYPMRDPADEDKRLVTGSPSSRDEINHFLYAGARDWTQPFRVLIAGGGTGDALIMLAQQLADANCPAEIIYVDLSKASRAIAQARAARRGLQTITFHTGSLLDAADLGPFDYIDCCGVLHHLPEPLAGFKALCAALAPEGGMGIMVYGELGRTGVYDAQEMLRDLMKDSDRTEARIDLTKRLLSDLPDTNRLKRNPFVSDHLANDAGLVDLLLHSRDRAYRVPQIYAALAAAELEMIGFVAPANYDPDHLVSDAKVKARLTRLSRPEREAFAELFTGNIKKHIFYCARQGAAADRTAAFAPEMIPILHDADLATIMPMVKAGKPLGGRREGLKLALPLPTLAAQILELCDGKRTFEDIHKALKPARSRQDFMDQARRFYRAFHALNLMLLKRGL